MKRISLLLIAVLLADISLVFGQHSSDPVLFTYGNREVTQSEFQYVFEKNNPEIEDPTLADLKDYLELYINFKIKVAAAQDARIDTVPSVRNDLKNYLDQLYQSYLDKVIMDPLMAEVEERWKYDIRAKHILVKVPNDAKPGDTAAAYDKIMNIRSRIINGEDFDKVAMETSDDKYVKRNKGDLGYISVLRLPYYEFENKLYNTQVGEVSMPVRTRLGYHIIMPTERRASVGTVRVGHILVSLQPDAGENEQREAKEKIETIYQKLKKGEEFGTLARKYSDDEMTKTKGGEMQPFSAGEMVPEFENAAFGLEEDSALTKPFRTRYGYHILMLLDKKERPSFEENEARLRRQVKKDPRYEKALKEKKRQFMNEYDFEELDPDWLEITSRLDSSLYAGGYVVQQIGDSQPLFEIGGAVYTAFDLLQYIARYQPYNKEKSFDQIVNEAYSQFRERKIMETAISDQYPDYSKLKQEYKDGILMFAMMQDSVWNRAMQDSAGLAAYYQKHKGEYMWEKRVDATVFHVHDPEAVSFKQLKKKAKRKSKAELYEQFNDTMKMNLQIDSFLVERGMKDITDSVKWEKGWSRKFPDSKGSGYQIVKVNRVLGPEQKTLSEARGAYIADYQSKLEEEWVATLRQRYPVKVHEEVLKALVE